MTQAEAVLDLKQWGNNLGVRLPMVVARAAHLHVNQKVRVAVEDGRVIITPVEDASLTLEQRLALFDPARHSGEAMENEPLGAEKW
jgi:antitoxin MazE